MKTQSQVRHYPITALIFTVIYLALFNNIKAQEPKLRFRDFPANFDSSIEYYFKNDLDSAEMLCRHAMRYFDSINQPEKAVVASMKLSELYQHLRFDDAKAYDAFFQTLQILTKNPQLDFYDPYFFVNLGNILFRYELNDRALLSYQEALKYVDSEKHPSARITIYQNIGQVFYSLKNYDSSLYYFNKAQQSIYNNSDVLQAQQYYFMSQYYYQLNQKDSALHYTRLNQEYLLKIKPEIENKDKPDVVALQLWYQYIILSFVMDGDIAAQQKNYDEAIGKYELAISFTRKEGPTNKLSALKNKIGGIHFEKKDYRQAFVYCDSALNISMKYGFKSQIAAAARMLEQISEHYPNARPRDYYTRLRLEIENESEKQKKEAEAYKDKMKFATASLETGLYNLNKTKEYYQTSLDNITRINRITWALSAAVVIILLMLLRSLYIRKKMAALNYKFAEKELEEAKIKLALKNRELASKAIRLAEVTEYSGALYESIENLKSSGNEFPAKASSELSGIIEKISSKSAWKEFEENFEQVHEGFYKKLLEQYPNLTPAEIKVCSLLKTNMTTKDIALLTNRSVRTIENTRNSIRRKMNLPANANLVNHLLNF